MANRNTISIILTLAAGMLGSAAPGILLADFGPPMAVRITLALLPYTALPFAIGWLTPNRWWWAGAALLMPVPFAALLLITAMPQSLAELWVRAPLFLPPVLTITFALMGRLLGQLWLRRRV